MCSSDLTYRLGGHYFADSGAYMDKERLSAEKARDPVHALRQQLIEEGRVTEQQLARIDQEVLQQVEQDIAHVLDTPAPPANRADLMRDVYAEATFSPIGRRRPAAPAKPTGSTRKATMREAFNDALSIAMSRDSSVIMLGEDIADPAGGEIGRASCRERV